MMPRAWIWLQLILGWLPMWALYGTLIYTSHPLSPMRAGIGAFRAIASAAILSLAVQRLTGRLPWPHPFHLRFLAIHFAGAVAYSLAWFGLLIIIDSISMGAGRLAIPYRVSGHLVLGIWFYVMVAGVAYATRATERAARAEALAARSQLAALRAQLNPHFLFNALHTVVQLIPREPRRAAQAAEQVAGLLRTTIEEDRDLVSLAEEAAFVERYLDVERIRFGDRLRVRLELPPDAHDESVPSFALQTLVENAIRHGAAPNVEPTDVIVSGQVGPDRLTLTVHDTGVGASPERLGNGAGTGLQRLRDRLAALYGDRARLELGPESRGGFTASLIIPRVDGR